MDESELLDRPVLNMTVQVHFEVMLSVILTNPEEGRYFWFSELLLILDRLEIPPLVPRPPFVTCSSYKVSISLKRSCTDPLRIHSKIILKLLFLGRSKIERSFGGKWTVLR